MSAISTACSWWGFIIVANVTSWSLKSCPASAEEDGAAVAEELLPLIPFIPLVPEEVSEEQEARVIAVARTRVLVRRVRVVVMRVVSVQSV
ncbi:hypothetical protein [Rathayibacter sp. PhB179]|uniref:hypothetical protein n=1 Tax=unclassified Rathayibacter TaxID=2609250 RepID=UPI003260C2E5